MNFYDYVNSLIANYDYVANSNKTLIRYCFTFKQIEPLFSKIIRDELNKELDILFGNRESFLKFEIAFHQSDKKLYSSYTYVFQKIVSEYLGREFPRPSQVTIAANTLNFIELYSLNCELTELVIQKLNEEYHKLSPLNQKENFKLLRKTLINSNYFHTSKSLDELIEFIFKNIELSNYQKCALRKLSSIKKKNIIIGKIIHDITNLYVLNKKIYNQYENILKKLSNQIERKKLILTTKLIKKYFKIKPQAIELFKEHALDAFIFNNYNLLLDFKEHVTGEQFNLFTYILEIHLNKKLEYRSFNTKTLFFTFLYFFGIDIFVLITCLVDENLELIIFLC